MIDNTLLNLVKVALVQLELYIEKYERGTPSTSILGTKKVLSLLEIEASNFPNIPERLLRAVHYISIAAVKEYDRTTLEEAILNIARELYKIPGYSKLEPLRGDFGKGIPI